MKRSDKYPPGTEEDARNLPPQTKVMGLHPLVWGMLAVFVIAGVGLYAETVGFYEIDDFGEMMTGHEHDGEETDAKKSEGHDDTHQDDSETPLFSTSPDASKSDGHETPATAD